MINFEFATTGRIIFGPGKLKEIGPLAAPLGKTALICVGMELERATNLLNLLEKAGIVTHLYQVREEPSLTSVNEAAALAKQFSCDLMVGFGGGSSIDTAKAVAALLANGGDLLDYLEVIGKGKPLQKDSLPCIAIPTTAGTGAEVTRNAVIASPEQQVKASLRSPGMLPRLALVDPELTYSLPKHVTASTGLDALTQLIEPFVSIKANPLTDAICREGLPHAARWLLEAYKHGDNPEARLNMSLASLFGGLALANSGLGVAHGFAAPIGGEFHGPHGAICARLLPLVMQANIKALQQRQPDSQAVQRYTEIAQILTGRPEASSQDGAAWVQQLVEDLKVPDLSEYGIKSNHVPSLVEKAAQASSTKANPIQLTQVELTGILEQAL